MNEATYWRQRYEVLMATFADAVKAAGLPPPPVMLTEKESYEAGRIAGMAAQRKPWVGLTDEQLVQLSLEWPPETNDWASHIDFARAIEAKLKEKNA